MLKNTDSRELHTVYDEHFQNDGLRDSDAFYKWVIRKLQVEPRKTLLDVACGSGRLLRYACQAGLQAIGLDFSTVGLTCAHTIEFDARLVRGDGQELPLADNSVDYVTNLGSLEHFVDPSKGVKEMARVLRSAGEAAIVLPNAYYVADLIWWVWRKGRSPSHSQPIERFAAFEDWRDLLEENGLQVFNSYKYNFMFPRSRVDWRWYRRFPRKLLNLAISPVIPFQFSYSFLYLCRKVSGRE